MTNRETELLKFMQSLHNRGMLTKSPDEIDYEWVVWDYLNCLKTPIKVSKIMINDKTPPKSAQSIKIFDKFELALRYACRNYHPYKYFLILKLESNKMFHVCFYRANLTGKKWIKVAEHQNGQYNEFSACN